MTDHLRFMRFVRIHRPGGCWVWTGSTKKVTGHGRFRWNGKNGYAHRAAYELFVGPIPDGLLLHHTCGNPPCVNPEHLEPANDLEHRHKHLVPECPAGHLYTEENTQMVSQGEGRPKKRRCRKCAKAYMAAYYKRTRR